MTKKAKIILGTNFRDSGLRDSSNLPDLLIRRCSPLFDTVYYEFKFQKKVIGVIHIPPVLDKPVLIRNHQTFDREGKLKNEYSQRILVRKGTAIHPANKHDIDLMYYDRKNLKPEYEYSLDVIKLQFKAGDIKFKNYNPKYKIKNEVNLSLTMENIGRRNITVKQTRVELSTIDQKIILDKVSLNSNGKIMNLDGSKTFVIETGKTVEFLITAYETNLDKPVDIRDYDELVVVLILSNNKQLSGSYTIADYL